MSTPESTTAGTHAASEPMTLGQRLSVWRTAYNTANLPVGMTRPPDAVSKWLVITRAAVFSMTATSGLIGGLLAVGAARLTGEVSVTGGCWPWRSSAWWSPTPRTT